MHPSSKKIIQFKKTVWDFYRAHKRILPWRKTKNPYKILASEFMLQQTQVSAVLKKYPEFLKQFPNISSLANAKKKDVLKDWLGLGYNKRALNLLKTAKQIEKNHHSRIPKNPEELTALPGIGKATADSILAFAFNIPTVFIETNIRRVFIHHFFSKKKSVHDSDLLPIIEKTLDQKNPREWYWALMDYGSHITKTVPNPNKKSVHYSRQSTFKGSDRELRGKILKTLTIKSYTQKEIESQNKRNKERIQKILKQLEKESFIKKTGTIYSLK